MSWGMIWLTIFGMATVTYGIRFLPLTIIDQDALPIWAKRGLGYVPIAVLSAIIAPALIPSKAWGEFQFGAELVAGLVAAVVAWYTRSTIATIVVGVVILVLLK